MTGERQELIKYRLQRAYETLEVKGLFNREFIKPGLIPTKWGKIYEDAFRDRQEGDYLDYIEFSLAEVKEMQKQGQEFVTVINNFLRQNQTIT